MDPGVGLKPEAPVKTVRLNRNKNERLSNENEIPTKRNENS
jgi:hypothetical protein